MENAIVVPIIGDGALIFVILVLVFIVLWVIRGN